MAVEVALIQLGAVAVRSAVKLWLSDNKIAEEVGGHAIDLVAARLSRERDKRKFVRMVENFEDTVIERLEPILEIEFRGLPANERIAAVLAVVDVFQRAKLDDRDLFAADLDARHLDRTVRGAGLEVTRDLSADAVALFDLLLLECCGYVIEISRGLPPFTVNALTELLQRERQVLDGIKEVLARLPPRGREAGFVYDYRQLVARTLDHVELFGATVSDASRRYPLSVAYISLTVAESSQSPYEQGRRVEDHLTNSYRHLIRGEAGLGKTTLLRWIAVHCARGDFGAPLTRWNGLVPFFIPLRRYADRDLPVPQQFLFEVGRHISDEMPPGWVREQLDSGAAVVLVDGVDELAEHRRQEVRDWIHELVDSFPNARYVVTSRPGAASATWLDHEGFNVLDLQPMTPSDTRVFIDRWYDAMRVQCVDEAEKAELDMYQARFLEQIDFRGHLRKLAGYPLLCALLCALHRDRRAALPSNRMELYDVALQMLLERLDAERNIRSLDGLHRTEKTLLLSDLAYWLIRNDAADVAVDRAIARIDGRLKSMAQVEGGVAAVYRYLVERSGLLRESTADRVDFVHRTFQEYLAARSAVVDSDDIGVLVGNADKDQWSQVIVMAAGHATSSQRKELLEGLLDRGRAENNATFLLLAVAALETAPELEPALRQRILDSTASLLPPSSEAIADTLAAAGSFALDLLGTVQPRSVREVVYTIRAAAGTGLNEAVPVIARFRDDRRGAVHQEILRHWPRFDPHLYAERVLSHLPVDSVALADPSMLSACALLPNVRKLTCPAGRVVVLGDLPPQLEELNLSIEFDTHLVASRSHTLRSLSVSARYASGEITVSLEGELGGKTRLNSFTANNVTVVNLDELRRMEVVKLSMCNAVSAPTLATMASWVLVELHLDNVFGLEDLEALSFAKCLKILRLENCQELSWIDGIDQWAESLEELSIRNCHGIDLNADEVVGKMVSLPRLRKVELGGTGDSSTLALKLVESGKVVDLAAER
ncbi:NACHT domain-containing NTPase [Amycolatopsis sp. MtRt-6]|uniref:NACHT domain-containing protein n=1 Tax=Amycolatopsis sp. MtRt-6 TaxID=2792782 RepID=UPI001A8F9CFF|nr:NACHT domain-containing protein [Amycolatopsis sp. MtRt-6]